MSADILACWLEKQMDFMYESGRMEPFIKYTMEREARPLQEEITNLKNQLGQVEGQRNQQQEEITNLRNQLSQLGEHKNRLESENAQLRTDQEAMLNSNNKLENVFQMEKEIIHLRSHAEKITEEHKHVTDEVEDLQSQLNKAKDRMNQMAQNNTILENDLRMMLIEATTQLSVVNEKVAHFAEELLEKRTDLPTLGENNTEELEIQKFVEFVIDNTIQLKELAPDGLNMLPGQLPSRITVKNCMLCHEQPRFAKCTTEACGNTYHKECIQKWFKTRRNCPCCHNDSVRFEEENDDE